MIKSKYKIPAHLKKYVVISSETILFSFQKMSSNKKKFLIVVDKLTYKVLGTITDGDIRRSIWKKVNLDGPIKKIINKKFFFIDKNFSIKKIVESSEFNLNYNHIPIIKKGFIINIIFKSQIDKYLNEIEKNSIKYNCIIMAGGFGKRLLPYTKILPKPLLPFKYGEPIISKQINFFLKHKVDKIIISLGYHGELIKSFLLTKFGTKKINFLNEKKPLGTAGSIKLIKKLKDVLVIINCDTLTNLNIQELVKFHSRNKNDITVVSSVVENKISYGVCDVDKNGNLLSVKEKPLIKNLAQIGLYVINNKIISLIPANEKYDFDQLINKSIKKNLKIKVYPIPKKSWTDVGTL